MASPKATGIRMRFSVAEAERAADLASVMGFEASAILLAALRRGLTYYEGAYKEELRDLYRTRGDSEAEATDSPPDEPQEAREQKWRDRLRRAGGTARKDYQSQESRTGYDKDAQ